MCARAVRVRARARLLRAGVSYALEETLCGDTICGTYGTEPSFDDDNRPPDGKTLGRCEPCPRNCARAPGRALRNIDAPSLGHPVKSVRKGALLSSKCLLASQA